MRPRTNLLQHLQRHFPAVLAQQLLTSSELDASGARFRDFLAQTVVVESSTPPAPHALPEAHIDALTYSEFVDLIVDGRLSASQGPGAGSGRFSFMSDRLKQPMWAKLCTRLGRRRFAALIGSVDAVFEQDAPHVSLKWDGFTQPQLRAKPALSKQAMYYLTRDARQDFRLLFRPTAELVGAVTGQTVAERRVPRRLRGLYSLLDSARHREQLLDYAQLLWLVEKPHSDPQCVFDNRTAPSRVVKAVCAVVFRLFPSSSFGSEHNTSQITSALAGFLRLLRRLPFDVDALLHSLRLAQIPWLGRTQAVTSRQDFEARIKLLKSFLAFLFGGLVVDFVRTYWYVTENQTGDACANDYYARRVWQRLTQTWLREYMRRFLVRVDAPQPGAGALHAVLGTLRLVPKRTDLRPLCVPFHPTRDLSSGGTRASSNYAACPAKTRYSCDTVRPIRDILRHQQVRYHQQHQHSATGCHSVREVGLQVLQFKRTLLAKYPSLPHIYGIQFDMKHCYDNLSQAKIIACIEELFSIDAPHEEYFLRNVLSVSADCARYRRNFNLVSNRADMESLNAFRSDAVAARRDVIADNRRTTKYNKSDVLDLVRSQVIDSTVQIPDLGYQTYQRSRGVFQGFALLATLCDIVYNSLVDRVLLAGTSGRDFTFVRLVDDFLFLTTSKEDCTTVFNNALSAQAQEFGAYMNLEKLKSLDSLEPGPADANYVGLCIDIRSLSVRNGPVPPVHMPPRCANSCQASMAHLDRYVTQRLHDYLIDLDLVPVCAALENLELLLDPVVDAVARVAKAFRELNEKLTLQVHTHRILVRVCQRWDAVNGLVYTTELHGLIEIFRGKFEAALQVAPSQTS